MTQWYPYQPPCHFCLYSLISVSICPSCIDAVDILCKMYWQHPPTSGHEHCLILFCSQNCEWEAIQRTLKFGTYNIKLLICRKEKKTTVSFCNCIATFTFTHKCYILVQIKWETQTWLIIACFCHYNLQFSYVHGWELGNHWVCGQFDRKVVVVTDTH